MGDYPSSVGEFIQLCTLELRNIDLHDLNQITQLHRRVFSDSALTKLGFEPVRRYYRWQLAGPHDCYAVGVFDDEKLVGFCVAGVFRESLKGYLNSNKWFLLFWILFHPWLFKNPIVKERITLALSLIRPKRPHGTDFQTIIPNSYGILSIAVDPERQGAGIGRKIINNVEMHALTKGFHKLHLSVHTENKKGIAFYENNGWEQVIEKDGVWNGKMEKKI